MQIENGKVVAFHYVLKDDAGTEIERSDDNSPMIYLHGYRNILPGLEAALAGKTEGDDVTVSLPPERAYGLRREDSLQRIPIKHLSAKPRRLQPGMAVKVNTQDGPRDVTVVKVGKFSVDVDANHPLAGKAITFDIRIEKVREASPEELAHRHSHGIEGGHHH
ncbi:MAG: peptidylprolyl isomerase [Pseudomonadota bacterium]